MDDKERQDVETLVSQAIRRVEASTSTALETYVADRLAAQNKAQTEALEKRINAILDTLDKNVQESNKLLNAAKPVRPIKVRNKVIKGLKHHRLEDLMKLLLAKQRPLLVGPAGSGKSMSTQQCAEALNLKFYVQSVGAQTSMSNIFGFVDGYGNYRGTHFRTAYEHGGLFCMDEIDAGNANVLVGINSALSNGLCAFPDAIVPEHKDFLFVATANTVGRGANHKYAGRNRLDEATLDRFVPLWWDYDKDLEVILAGDRPEEQDWLHFVWKVRDYVDNNGINVVVGTRAVIKGRALIPHFSKARITEMVILTNIPSEHHNAIKGL